MFLTCNTPAGAKLHPDGRFRSRWDLTLAIVLLFVCFVVPIRVAFPENFVSVQIAWLVVDSIFDSLFIIDLLLNFITGFAKDGTVVMEPVPIMKHYLATDVSGTATRRKSSLGGKDRLPIGPPQGLRPAPGTDKVAPYTEGGKEIE